MLQDETPSLLAEQEWAELEKSSSEKTLSDKIMDVSDDEIVEDSDISVPPPIITASKCLDHLTSIDCDS